MLFDVGNGVSESCLPGSPGIPRNPPAGKSVHPVADIAGAGTTPAVQCNKAAFAPRNAAAVRLVPPGDRLPVAYTGTAVAAASAVVPAGDTPVAVPASAAVQVAVEAVVHTVGVAVEASVRPAAGPPVSVPLHTGLPVAEAVARPAP